MTTPDDQNSLYKRIIRRISSFAVVILLFCSLNPSGCTIYPYRYREDAKKGRAGADMRRIEQNYKKYHQEHGRWPQTIEDIAPQLEPFGPGLLDPWGNPYSVSIETFKPEGGDAIERPIVYCQPPNKEQIRWPEK